MGHVGKLTHPAVMELMALAARRCKAVGKPVGTVGGTAEVVTQYRAMGYDFLAIGSDLGLMMRACQGAVNALTARETEHVHDLADGTRAPQGY
jgi:2-dehydro-3-deoxyglucarate aldolase